MKDYLFTIIEVIGVVQCLFIAAALHYLPGNHKHGNRLLSVLLLVFAVEFVAFVINQNDLLFLLPIFTFMRLPLLFLYGPLLFIYLKRITNNGKIENGACEKLHYIPFALMTLAFLPSFGLSNIELLHVSYYRELVVLYPATAQLNSIEEWLLVLGTRICMPAFALHLGLYMVLCLRLLAEHKRRIREHFSDLDKISLDWMRNLLFGYAAMALLVAVREAFFAGTPVGYLIGSSLAPLLVLFVCALGLFGLLQKNITMPLAAAVEPTPPSSETALKKYQGSTLTDQQQAEGAKDLIAFMKKAKPYLDSELTITDLAAQMGLPSRHLSQIINGRLRQNFLDFVNSYRVEEARRHLEDPALQLSILAIAMEVGFNSKSAFYNAFKRHVHQTPTSYRQSSAAARAPDLQAKS